MEWSSKITTVALEMVLPAAGGYWVDLKLGTKFVFVLLGMVLGLAVGMRHLIRMTATKKSPSDRRA